MEVLLSRLSTIETNNWCVAMCFQERCTMRRSFADPLLKMEGDVQLGWNWSRI